KNARRPQPVNANLYKTSTKAFIMKETVEMPPTCFKCFNAELQPVGFAPTPRGVADVPWAFLKQLTRAIQIRVAGGGEQSAANAKGTVAAVEHGARDERPRQGHGQ